MASVDGFSAIETRLRDNWSATALYFENEDWTLDDDPAHFLFVEVYGDSYRQASIGSGAIADNLWREDVTVLVHVMTRQGIGSTEARTLSGQAVDLFRTATDLGALRFVEASVGSGQPGTNDGNYWRMTARMDFTRDEG